MKPMQMRRSALMGLSLLALRCGSAPTDVPVPPPPPPPLTRVIMYRQTPGAEPEVLADGSAVHPDDRLMPCVAGDSGWASLIGQDGEGVPTFYGQWPLTSGDRLSCAPFAVALDDAPGPERFWIGLAPQEQTRLSLAPAADAIGWTFPKTSSPYTP